MAYSLTSVGRERLVVPRPAREVRHAEREQDGGDGGGERAILDAEADDVLRDYVDLRRFGVADALFELGGRDERGRQCLRIERGCTQMVMHTR